MFRRNRLQGLLLVLSRWQDYGASAGMDLHGTTLYAQVVERCKDGLRCSGTFKDTVFTFLHIMFILFDNFMV